MTSQWLSKAADRASVETLSRSLNIHPITAAVLANRGLTDPESAGPFLNPSLQLFHNPLLLPDMEKAVGLVRAALDQKKKIMIYGDSDTDGVTGTALLVRAFETLGGRVVWYVPGDEDYGLQKEVFERFIKDGAELCISVDTGTSAHEAIAFANSLGAQVIVTDHHLPSGELPEAAAVVNPNRADSTYPFKGICGCFTAFKLAQGVMMSFGKGGLKNPDVLAEPRMKHFLEDNLDLVALSVIADVSPLKDENRAAVVHGLKALANTRKLGVRLLLHEAGIAPGAVPTPKDAGWKIIPLLNAAGRRGQSAQACELLLTETEYRAKDLVLALRKFNDQRRQIQKSHETIFLKAVSEQCRPEEDKILVLLANDLEMGVTGLVATGLVRKYKKPVVLLIAKDGRAVGSGRAFGTFDMLKAFDACKDLLTRYGGHKAAAGIAMPEASVPEFRQRILAHTADGTSETQESVLYDAEITPEDVTVKLCEELQKLEPFGPGNEAPLFFLSKALVQDATRLGQTGDHLKFWVRKGLKRFCEGVAWGRSDLYEIFATREEADLLVRLETNSWNGKTSARLELVDCRFEDQGVEACPPKQHKSESSAEAVFTI